MKYSSQSKINLIKKIIVHKQNIVLDLVSKSVCSPKIFKVKGAGTFYKEAFWYYSISNVQSNNP